MAFYRPLEQLTITMKCLNRKLVRALRPLSEFHANTVGATVIIFI